MIFRALKVEACPHCRCTLVSSEGCESDRWDGTGSLRTHVNGQRWEWRQFTCGYRVMWIPNFQRPEEQHVCNSSPAEIKKRNARAAARDAVLTLISKLDVDAEWRSRVENTLT